MTPVIPTLRAESDTAEIRLFRDGKPEPLLVQHADPGRRAYIHPILAPDGLGILTEDAPPHHPWQHGLYVGLNAVNGVGFWKEGGAEGTFHPNPLERPAVEGSRARWHVESEWRAPNREPVLLERQDWTFTDHRDTYTLDLDWSLRGLVDVAFGQYPYGGLFLRMPYTPEGGGEAVNSEGRRGRDAEAQRARWVAVSMPISGRNDVAGIAMMDHPDNPAYPVPWRVDNQLGIAPSRCIAGEWRLPKGQSVLFRHRLYIYVGATDATRIEADWKAFTGRPTL